MPGVRPFSSKGKSESRAVKSIEFKFWWLSHRSVGSNPDHDTCVLEQNAIIASLHPGRGYKWVPVRVEVGSVF